MGKDKFYGSDKTGTIEKMRMFIDGIGKNFLRRKKVGSKKNTDRNKREWKYG